MKRIFDIAASVCGLIVLSPLFLILAVWIKLDSKGPVFYRQVRVGKNNKDFRIFKFRSMRARSDKVSRGGMWWCATADSAVRRHRMSVHRRDAERYSAR